MANPLAFHIDIESKTITKALDIIAHAGYTLYEPTKIRRKAKAESDASIIKAKGDINVSRLQRQALYRLANLETIHQKNINQITEKALKNLHESGKPIDQQVDTDWVRKYFNFSQDISNEEMQNIWSKVLSGEFIRNGSYSYKTMSILANMRQDDANLFSRICGYTAIVGGGRKVPLIFPDPSEAKYSNGTFSFEDLQHLESLGLIHFNSISGFKLTVGSAKTIPVQCGNEIYVINTNEEKIEFAVGEVLMTREAQELFQVVNAEPFSKLIEIVTQKWITPGRSLVRIDR